MTGVILHCMPQHILFTLPVVILFTDYEAYLHLNRKPEIKQTKDKENHRASS